jgi:hypothetical protein
VSRSSGGSLSQCVHNAVVAAAGSCAAGAGAVAAQHLREVYPFCGVPVAAGTPRALAPRPGREAGTQTVFMVLEQRPPIGGSISKGCSPAGIVAACATKPDIIVGAISAPRMGRLMPIVSLWRARSG